MWALVFIIVKIDYLLYLILKSILLIKSGIFKNSEICSVLNYKCIEYVMYLFAKHIVYVIE